MISVLSVGCRLTYHELLQLRMSLSPAICENYIKWILRYIKLLEEHCVHVCL